MKGHAATNLFGEPPNLRAAKIMTFADEIKPSEQSAWAYIGIVSVPANQLTEAVSRLQSDRDKIDFHYEVGWSDLKKPGKCASPGKREELITRWLARLANETDIWRFSILGIDTSRLNLCKFGVQKGDQIANAYRRFYRSNLGHHVTQLHRSHDTVEVVKCFHDEEGRLEADSWFSWHPQAVIGLQNSVTFLENSVTFVNSCHLKENTHIYASHMIQLCDVALGATRYIFEDVGANSARDRAVAPFFSTHSALKLFQAV